MTWTRAPRASGHLGREVGGTTEPVDAEPASVGQVGPPQGAVADDPGAEQGRHLHVVEHRRAARRRRPRRPRRRRAYPPSTSQPVKRGSRHRFSRPERQKRQVPQVWASQGTPMRSPSRHRVLPAPSRSTTPTTSCPGVTRGRCGARSPSVRWRSVRHTPQARTRTRTSPGPGSGTGLSTRTSGWVSPSHRSGPFDHPCLHDVLDAGQRRGSAYDAVGQGERMRTMSRGFARSRARAFERC